MNDDFISNEFESKIVTKTNAAKKQLLNLFMKIREINLEFNDLPTKTQTRKIAALDGGGFSEELIGITLTPARAAGAIFEIEKTPIWIELNDVEILTLEEDPKNFGALLRDFLEVQIALKLAKHEPEIIFLDGSITAFAYKGIPQSLRYSLQDGKEIEDDSVGYKFYSLFLQYIKASYQLMKECLEKNILLVGVSKDSKANTFVKKIFEKEKNHPLISDTSMVNIIANGRTGFTKAITFQPEIRDVRKRIWQAANVFQEEELQSFCLTYIILKENAQPIRVDTLLPQKNRFAEVINALVTYHDGNGFFTPAYLTHAKAHMSIDLGKRIVNYISEEFFNDEPELFQSFFWLQRRDIVQ